MIDATNYTNEVKSTFPNSNDTFLSGFSIGTDYTYTRPSTYNFVFNGISMEVPYNIQVVINGANSIKLIDKRVYGQSQSYTNATNNG